MQLGMIGLGRMGANMVRRLVRNGHACVVYDRNPSAATDLASEGATAAASLADLVHKLAAASRHLADGAGRGRRRQRSPTCCRCSSPTTS